VAEYLRLNPDMPATLSAFYQAKRDFFAQRMNATRFRALPCPGSYFQLYDYRAISDQPDLEFAHWLTTTHGVAAIPVSVFYHQAPADLRLLRFCFAKTEAEMAAASERLQCV
jgi:methionine aminotransferase